MSGGHSWWCFGVFSKRWEPNFSQLYIKHGKSSQCDQEWFKKIPTVSTVVKVYTKKGKTPKKILHNLWEHLFVTSFMPKSMILIGIFLRFNINMLGLHFSVLFLKNNIFVRLNEERVVGYRQHLLILLIRVYYGLFKSVYISSLSLKKKVTTFYFMKRNVCDILSTPR